MAQSWPWGSQIAVKKKDARKCQESLDGDQKGKYYCVYFDEGRYWGRLMKVFLDDVDTVANRFNMKFLHYMCSCWEFLKNQGH